VFVVEEEEEEEEEEKYHQTVIYGSQWVEFQIPSLSVVGYMIRLM
jgi:hypothetical protein